jgi:hypothetical protein
MLGDLRRRSLGGGECRVVGHEVLSIAQRLAPPDFSVMPDVIRGDGRKALG